MDAYVPPAPQPTGLNPWQQGMQQRLQPGSTQDINGYHGAGTDPRMNQQFAGIQENIPQGDGTSPWMGMAQPASGQPQPQQLQQPQIQGATVPSNGLFSTMNPISGGLF